MPSISTSVTTHPAVASIETRYLDLMKRALTRALTAQPVERHTLRVGRPVLRMAKRVIDLTLAPLSLELVRVIRPNAIDYVESGHSATNRQESAETMLGTRQLDSMQQCITDVIERGVAGDLAEAGVWRGGMSIFMKAVLTALRADDRALWVVDSFAGLPDPERTQDSFGWKGGDMAVSLDEVRDNFARFGLLDDNVHFLKGFFSDTLPTAPIGPLAILRVDADLYESTRDVLVSLYPRLSPGGYAIFDDYQNLPDCRRAIDEYRAANGITEAIVPIDTRAVYWQTTSAAAPATHATGGDAERDAGQAAAIRKR